MIFFAHLHYLVPFIWIGIFFYLLLPAMFFLPRTPFETSIAMSYKISIFIPQKNIAQQSCKCLKKWIVSSHTIPCLICALVQPHAVLLVIKHSAVKAALARHFCRNILQLATSTIFRAIEWLLTDHNSWEQYSSSALSISVLTVVSNMR